MEVASIDTSFVHPGLRTSHFTVACDVQNPFCGPEGAAYIFAPQKGADRKMVEALDAGMKNFAEVIFHKTGKDISNHPGAGAAGGMGGSLLAFLNAELKPGIQLMLDTLEKSKSPFLYHSINCSYVPTGEEPVASPSTQSGFMITCAEIIFAAFLLNSL